MIKVEYCFDQVYDAKAFTLKVKTFLKVTIKSQSIL